MRLALVLTLTLVSSNGLSTSVWAQQAAGSSSTVALDFEFFRTKVQPILLAKRPGHARCVACHIGGTPMQLQPLTANSATWSDADARKNFDVVSKVAVVAGNPQSRLLVHPLAEAAGGDFYHSGGKHWKTQDDPEWQTLRAWVLGAAARGAK